MTQRLRLPEAHVRYLELIYPDCSPSQAVKRFVAECEDRAAHPGGWGSEVRIEASGERRLKIEDCPPVEGAELMGRITRDAEMFGFILVVKSRGTF